MWGLLPEFRDPLPYLFTLQTAQTGLPDDNAWENVGLPVENGFYAVDPDQRDFGKVVLTYYRLKLVTPSGTYYSDPVNALGTLARRDWNLAREFLRKERLLARLAFQDGFLIKRRISGPKCKVCLDVLTQQSRNPNCPSCLGTAYECGYYPAMPCVWASPTPRQSRVQLDAGQGRGTIDDIAQSARMLLVPTMIDQDVWVARATDDRYTIHEIRHAAEWRGVPLIGNVELRPLPFTSIVYTIDIPDQTDLYGNPLS
jgi:hypothetical protein